MKSFDDQKIKLSLSGSIEKTIDSRLVEKMPAQFGRNEGRERVIVNTEN